MGKVTEKNKKRKKKGRPSLLDLQKRSLRQQQKQQNHQQDRSTTNPYSKPNFINPLASAQISYPGRRSRRRRLNADTISSAQDSIDEEDDERTEKKVKLVVRLPSGNRPVSQNPLSCGSDSNADGETPEAARKKRKIDAIADGSGEGVDEEEGEKLWKATDTLPVSRMDSGPTTRLPDKKLLVFILDRLQKKDTYGVFSEPVDPDELPDYHDIIEHPMDFGTLRKKLDGGVYSCLEQFEDDIFLICSNAMQYNAPDTIYFRQARSIEELAKKDFGNLRRDSSDDDTEPQPKVVRRGRPPKKPLEGAPFERLRLEFSSDATLATGRENIMLSNSYNFRKGTILSKFRPFDASIKNSYRSHSSDTVFLSERNYEFPASVLKADLKYGKREVAVDENRRDTYKDSYNSASMSELPLDGDPKQLIRVGLHVEHGYARSLARFSANLGPYVWKIASKKIETVLPAGLKFGPGWVGEDDTSPVQPYSLPGHQMPSLDLGVVHHPNRPLPPATSSFSNSCFAESRWCLPSKEELVDASAGLNSQSHLILSNSHAPPIQLKQNPMLISDTNGFKGELAQIATSGQAAAKGKSLLEETSVPPSSELPTHFILEDTKFLDILSRIHAGSSVVVNPDTGSHFQQNSFAVPSELNVRFQETGSTSSCLPICQMQQPELALQL